MSIGVWQSIATVLAMIAFAGVSWWAYNPRNRKRFEDDARIAIDTDPQHQTPDRTPPSREKQP